MRKKRLFAQREQDIVFLCDNSYVQTAGKVSPFESDSSLILDPHLSPDIATSSIGRKCLARNSKPESRLHIPPFDPTASKGIGSHP